MNKASIRILLIILVLALAAMSCVGGGGDGGTTGDGSSAVNNNNSLDAQSANATATYGAEQFHIQLTAIARPGP